MLSPAVHRYETKVTVPVEKDDFLRPLQNLERQSARVVSGDPADDAQALRVYRRREVVPQRRFPGWRQRQLEAGQILSDVAAGLCITRALPVPAQVRMPVCRSRSRLRLGGLVVDRRETALALRCCQPSAREEGPSVAQTAVATASRRRWCFTARSPSLSFLGCFAGAAVAGGSARHNPPIRQRHPPRIHEMRSVLGQIPVNHHSVPKLQVTAFEAPP